jgi:hypothetical protein
VPFSVRWQRIIAYGTVALGVIVLGLMHRSEFLTDWDSFGYTYLATHRQSSSFYLGRWWFVGLMHAAWLVARGIGGLTMNDAHVPLQVTSLALSALGAVGLAAWTGRLTGSRTAGNIAGVMAATGPVFWVYSTSVMTEGLALAAIAWSFYAWQRALSSPSDAEPGSGRAGLLWAGLAGFLFGVAVDVREPLVLFAAWPLASCRMCPGPRRLVLLRAAVLGAALSLSIGVAMGWAWSWRSGLGFFGSMLGWHHWITEATTQYPTRLSVNVAAVGSHLLDVVPLAVAVFLAVPVVAGLRAAWRLWRPGAHEEPVLRFTPAFWAALASVPYVLSLIINTDLPFNVRYGLPLGWLITPWAAELLASWIRTPGSEDDDPSWWRAVAAAVCCVYLVIWIAEPVIARREQSCSGISRYRRSMLSLPRGSVVMAGNGAPVAKFLVRMRVRPDLQVVEGGWNFPTESIGEIVAQAFADGRAVYVHPYRHAWTRRGTVSEQWRGVYRSVSRYECEALTPRTAPLVRVRPRLREVRQGEDDPATNRVLPCLLRDPASPAAPADGPQSETKRERHSA